MKQAKKSTFQRIFKDVRVAASYDPFSQIINLSKYNRADYKDVVFNKPSLGNIEKLSLFEHELTHWIDHVSTLWGQNHLVHLYNALNARANGDIDEFWRIRSFDITTHSNSFSDYYTVHYNSIPFNGIPWRYQISSGIRFSESGKPLHNKPILFVNFQSSNKIPLLRVPISIVSILESNATNSEFGLKMAMVYQIKDIVEKNLRKKEIEEEWLSTLYNEDFALYTVAAHLIANLNHQSDLVWTHDVSAAIGTLVLNLPDIEIDKMHIQETGSEEWDKRAIDFRTHRDKGFAFYNLAKNLVDEKGEKQYSLDDLLSCSGLSDISRLEEKIIKEMDNNLHNLIDGPFKKIALDTLKKGKQIFKIRGVDGRKKEFKKKLFEQELIPTVIYGDTYFDDSGFSASKTLSKLKSGSDLSPDEYFLLLEYFDSKFGEFLKICGI